MTINAMNKEQGCFGAASVFAHDSDICRSCRAFNGCADECLKVLEAIKDQVDVSDLLRRHEAARGASWLAAAKTADDLGCSGGENRFARDSDMCRGCGKYNVCAAESLSALGKLHGLANVHDLINRHEATRVKLGMKPAPVVSLEPPAPLNYKLATQNDSTHTNDETDKYQVLASLKTQTTECELLAAEPDLLDAMTDGFISASDEEFYAFLGKLTVAPTASSFDDEVDAPSASGEQIHAQSSADVHPLDNFEALLLSLDMTESDLASAEKIASDERASKRVAQADKYARRVAHEDEYARRAAQAKENDRLMAEYRPQRLAELAENLKMERSEKPSTSPTTSSAEVKDNVVPLFHGNTLMPSLDAKKNIEVTQPVIPIEKTSTSEVSYSFPISMDSIDHAGLCNLFKRIAGLVAECKTHGDYMLIRDEYCSLAIALNREGLMAPAFRPAPTIPKLKERRTATNMMLHRDSLVIDCHWLHCRGEAVIPRDPEYETLFDVDVPFQFDLAAHFACRNWSKLHRADEAFILTNWQQCQMKTMMGTDVRNRLDAAINASGRSEYRIRPKVVSVKRAMREWCNRDKRLIPYRQSYEDLWLARELLGAGSSMTEIARLGGFISGVPPSNVRTVQDKLERLDDHLSGGEKTRLGGYSVAYQGESTGACSGASKNDARLQAT